MAELIAIRESMVSCAIEATASFLSESVRELRKVSDVHNNMKTNLFFMAACYKRTDSEISQNKFILLIRAISISRMTYDANRKILRGFFELSSMVL